jgi:hypothetical protein
MQIACSSENPLLNLFHIYMGKVIAIYRNTLSNAVQRLRSKHLARYREFLIGSISHLMADLSLSRSDQEYVFARFSSEGIGFITKTLPLLAKSLEKGISEKKYQCPSSFKKSGPGSALPALLGSWFRDVFDWKGNLLDNPSPYSVYVIRQFCYHWYKLDLLSDPILDQKVVNGFLETERELKGLNIVEDSSIRLARSMISSVFSQFNLSELSPKHGPGVANGVKSQYQKFEKKLSSLPSVWMAPLLHFFNGNDFWHRYDRLPHKSIFDFRPMCSPKENSAKVILVPKDSRGPRIISCEPVENQYIQQGILDYMVKTLERHPITRGQVNFTSQQVNRDLAKEASMNQRFSTLDLKEASDRVSCKLVNALFSGALRDALMTSRSQFTVLPDGTQIELEKFAPMGSATCFPVLATSIYFVVVAHLVQVAGVDFKTASSSIFVYGDDIIVNTEYVDDCYAALDKVGLMVNKDKSFVNSLFAESCGFDAFRGNDVTPIRMKKGIVDLSSIKREDPSRVVALVHFANNLDKSGLLAYAQWCYTIAEKSLGALPYGPSDASFLCRLDDTGYAAERTYLEGKVVFKRRRNRKKYPLGGLFAVKRYLAVKTDDSDNVTPYGHMTRVWPKSPISNLDHIDPRMIPDFGVFSKPRDSILLDALVGTDFVLY